MLVSLKHPGARNHAEYVIAEVRRILSDDTLSERGMLTELVMLIETDKLRSGRMSIFELLGALSQAPDPP